MAKRKKTRKSPAPRRRRIGSVGSGDIMDAVAGIAGALAGRVLVNKVLKNQNDTIKGAVQVAAGFVLPKVVKKPIVKAAGTGMIISGGLSLLNSVAPNLLAGIGATDETQEVVVINGMDEIGAGDIAEINGMDEIGSDDISEINGMDEGDVYPY